MLIQQNLIFWQSSVIIGYGKSWLWYNNHKIFQITKLRSFLKDTTE